MKLSVSNIALTAFDHTAELASLPALGLTGLEVAPSRVWRETWHGLIASQVAEYRRTVEQAGLQIVGLHSLFWDQRELGLFRDADTRRRTIDFLAHLSGVCRDLGGRTLIFGSAWARNRNGLPMETAVSETVSFFSELCPRIEAHGTCFCFEPVGPDESDFVNSTFESIEIARRVNHPALRVQIDAKALVANNEARFEPFQAAAPLLVHYHANEPGLGIIGSTGKVDHPQLAQYLRRVDYRGYVSIEQRMLDANDPLDAVRRSAAALRAAYSAA